MRCVPVTKQNGIKHYKSAPFHPSTNGLVERFIQTFKNSMRAMKQDNKVLSHKIANFLLNYRNTPHSVTKKTPARLFIVAQDLIVLFHRPHTILESLNEAFD
jgi:transposase InsO family protein